MDEELSTHKRKLEADNLLENNLETDTSLGKDECVWKDLPSELLISIFEYLSYSDIDQIRFVCKQWNYLSRLPKFSKKTKVVISPANLPNLLEDLKNNKMESNKFTYNTLELNGLKMGDDLQLILEYLRPSVHKLELIDSEFISILNDRMPELEELVLENIPFTRNCDGFSVDLSKYKKLKALDITCFEIPLIIKMNMMSSLAREVTVRIEKLCLNITRHQEELIMRVLERQCNSLRHLEIAVYLDLDPDKYPKWKNAFALLRQLETLKIKKLCFPQGMEMFVDCFPDDRPLKHCEISFNGYLTDDFLKGIVNKWPLTLKSLKFKSCEDLTNNGIQHISRLRHCLRSFKIRKCPQVTFEGLLQVLIAEENTTLKTLTIGDMYTLDNETIKLLIKRLPELTHLTLKNCHTSITDETMDYVSKNSKLEYFSVLNCSSTSDM